ncbi:MAG: phage terminase large subunit, partial [Candidatus Sumerlaeia bacterium]|nr:phage terminase large subunit [Candidatus Sumerlaeia bacterium]
TETLLTELKVFGFLDSALGGSSRSHRADLAAIATVGIDRYGYCYVLDMWLQRATPTQQVKRIFELNERWNYHLFGIEANCFQALLLLPIEEERQRLKTVGRSNWRLPIEPVTHKQNKVSRIASLEPLITNGWLLFNERLPQVFFQQCRDFPESSHDDALDALEGAVALARRHSPLLNNLSRTTNPSSRRSLKALNNF